MPTPVNSILSSKTQLRHILFGEVLLTLPPPSSALEGASRVPPGLPHLRRLVGRVLTLSHQTWAPSPSPVLLLPLPLVRFCLPEWPKPERGVTVFRQIALNYTF